MLFRVLLLFFFAALAAPAFAQAPGQLPYTAIHNPEFVSAADATFLQNDDILLGVSSGKVAKAYPAADLTQHGAVSDALPDGPVSVTWCGVCNTGLVFRADVKGRTLHFQFDRMVGGNEVQKDAETGSSWQQATGEAIDGPLKGTRLRLYPVVRTTWAAWRKQYPHTVVLKPLPGYIDRMPAAAKRIKDVTRVSLEGAPRGANALDGRLPPRETVAGLEVGRDSMAFPFSQLRIARVVNERVGGLPVVIVHQPSSDTTTAFDARVKGRVLKFQPANADATAIIDLETRSTWNAYGLALEGPMKGTQLTQVVPISQFWFAWSQFRPGTRVFTAAGATATSTPARIVAWQSLSRLAIADDIEPLMSVSRAELAGSAVPSRSHDAEQTPAGAVFRYAVRTIEPAVVLTFHAGTREQHGPSVKLIREEKFPATKDQEASLLRMALPPGTRSAPHAAPGRGLVYVLEGKVESATDTNEPRTYTGGEVVFQPGVGAALTFRNTGSEPATLLLYHVGPKAR
jgi:quercetin dioxygenase-like cupin family protein